MRETLDAVGFFYHHSLWPTSPDVIESVRSLWRGSRFPIAPINLYWGLPPALENVRFRAVILHRTLFCAAHEPLGQVLPERLAEDDAAYKIVMFQDEQASTAEKLELCRTIGADCIFTCLAEQPGRELYGRTGAATVVSCLPGYVSERLRAAGRRFSMPDERRTIDIGYRGRRAPAAWGSEAAEKHVIAEQFAQLAGDSGLSMDIATDESSRIYGEDWYRFLASCRGTLGTESGATVRDPGAPDRVLPYRTIAPRHFEAAALGTCQLLYEGQYSGALEPDAHYLALRKDMSNFNDVLARFRDPGERLAIARRAREALIESGRFGYERFGMQVDGVLAASGAVSPAGPDARARILARVYPSRARWRARKAWVALRHGPWPGRERLQKLAGRSG